MKLKKKDSQQISTYYKKKDVVKTYDTRRFSGVGGKYIHNSEVSSLVDLVSLMTGKKKVLDLGAGRGRLSFVLKEKKLNVYCLEYSEEMVKELQKEIEKKHIFHQSVFDSFPKKEKFKTITSLRFFDHFNIFDQYRILENIVPHLDKGGSLVMTLLNKKSLEAGLSKFFPYGRYNFYYDMPLYLELFEKMGLKLKYQRSTFFLPRGSFLYFQKIPFFVYIAILFDKVLTRLFPQFCAMHVVVLEK